MNFLQNIAHDLLERFGSDMHNIAVVFPNKRASLFLSKYLAELSDTPVWSPAYITISDLFRNHSSLTVDNPISLICRLYDIFIRATGFQNETLDNFYGWGQLLLEDFDDIDKNMAPADKVFSLVSDLHVLDNADYLTDTQKEILKKFFESFTDDHTTRMQEKFLTLWNNLFNIYTQYRESLRNNGLAYEGMLYRDVVEKYTDDEVDDDHEYETYCIIGFNMLQKCEQKLFSLLKDKSLFYWDYSDFYLHDKHEAGHFIKQYLTVLPNSIDIDDSEEIRHLKDFMPSNGGNVTFLSATTENLQGRYVTKWLLENDRWKAGEKTAIVMADEKLLQTIITALPDCIDKVNITTGYPLAETQAATLVSQLILLQRDGLVIGTDRYRQKQVISILKHPYGHYIYKDADALCKNLKDNHRYYPDRKYLEGIEELAGENDGLKIVFQDIDCIEIHDVANTDQNLKLLTWLREVIRYVAMQIDDAFESEALFRMYKVIGVLSNLIADGTLKVDNNTLQRLLGQIVNTTTIPFHGEPVQGIQIMGVLESRCIDFDHVLLLSCNEGNMPKGEGDSSFIPHSVRQAYDLTTVENKVGIYSYYFHRLLQRCPDVTITYNSSTEGLNTGEMSRFMLQLMVECDGIQQKTLCAGQSAVALQPYDIAKTPEVISLVIKTLTASNGISPSSLSVYLRCQARYFYQHVVQLDSKDEDTEDMDGRTFGNVFHKAAYLMMRELRDSVSGVVSKESLQSLLDDTSHIEHIVDSAFTQELFKINDSKQHRPEYNGLQLINRSVIIRLMKNLINYDIKYAPIKIKLLEQRVDDTIEIALADGVMHLIKIGGYIDRLDEVRDTETGERRIRVIDYKTGSKMPGAIPSVEDVFKHEMVDVKHADYFLQTMLYSCIVCRDPNNNKESLPVSPQLFYVQLLHKKDFNPILHIEGQQESGKKTAPKLPINDIREYSDEYIAYLKAMIYEISDPSVPFKAQYNEDKCKVNCPFITLCKR